MIESLKKSYCERQKLERGPDTSDKLHVIKVNGKKIGRVVMKDSKLILHPGNYRFNTTEFELDRMVDFYGLGDIRHYVDSIQSNT